jgi:hypothetical protein
MVAATKNFRTFSIPSDFFRFFTCCVLSILDTNWTHQGISIDNRVLRCQIVISNIKSFHEIRQTKRAKETPRFHPLEEFNTFDHCRTGLATALVTKKSGDKSPHSISLQLLVFLRRFNENRKIGVRVLPEREEILISPARFRRVAQ